MCGVLFHPRARVARPETRSQPNAMDHGRRFHDPYSYDTPELHRSRDCRPHPDHCSICLPSQTFAGVERSRASLDNAATTDRPSKQTRNTYHECLNHPSPDAVAAVLIRPSLYVPASRSTLIRDLHQSPNATSCSSGLVEGVNGDFVLFVF